MVSEDVSHNAIRLGLSVLGVLVACVLLVTYFVSRETAIDITPIVVVGILAICGSRIVNKLNDR